MKMSSSVWTGAAHSVVSSGPVTVTSINVESIPTVVDKNICISEVKDFSLKKDVNVQNTEDILSDSEGELSKIDFTGVTMRSKKARSDDAHNGRIERPMSWEGELSDSEMKQENENESMKVEVDEMVAAADSSNSNNRMVVVEGEVMDEGSCVGTDAGDGGARGRIGGDDNINPVLPPLKFTSEVTVEEIADRANTNRIKPNPEIPLLVDKLLVSCYSNSSVVVRGNGGMGKNSIPAPTASPDSAIHGCYSPTPPQSQLQSQLSPISVRRHLPSSGFSSPCCFTPSASLSRNNSDASQYGGSQHSSCYSHSYSSVSVSPTQFSPTHSPIQGRHGYRNSTEFPSHSMNGSTFCSVNRQMGVDDGQANDSGQNEHGDEMNTFEDRVPPFSTDISHGPTGGLNASSGSGISRQQLINSPCPICGDKISGFHYGIFSCESCKGFFKRTVQNHKNYVCVRGSACPVTIATRKKCPACRFDKCLNMGMKLEAIRVDRTRGGRSTYPFSYTLPAGLTQVQNHSDTSLNLIKQETSDASPPSPRISNGPIPSLLQEIMEVEHLWQYNENEAPCTRTSNPSNGGNDLVTNLCNIADHRLYKIVKWCKSLPLFKNISIDDQISLLINAWCELLLFSCCYRSVNTPGEIRVSLGKSINLDQARELGLAPCIERMLNFTEHLRRLRIDRYEYVAMKVIVLLSSDSNLRDPEMARASQEKALQALQEYSVSHYPDMPSKFGELLLRIPDLQRTCQVGKEMLSNKKEGEGPGFNLLMELLGGDH